MGTDIDVQKLVEFSKAVSIQLMSPASGDTHTPDEQCTILPFPFN